MAVYTEVTADELERFIAGYDIGALLSCKGIAEGVENSNFLLHAQAGLYILTLYEKRVAIGDLPFFLGLMEHLAARGINCPQPVRSRQGNALGQIAGRPAVIVTFLDGVWMKTPSQSQCGQLGRAMAELHRAGADFGLRRPNALSLAAWPKLFKAAAARADEVASGLADETGAEIAFLQQHWPDGLPQGVIHADLFPDNVFFLGDRLSGLIDFYFACNDALAYDLAVCLNAWCFADAGGFDPNKAAALLEAYCGVRDLTEAEIAALPVLARGAALRFMLTRLVDWLNVPPGALVRPKDPLEYRSRLRFHQTVRTASEYGWR